MTKRKFTKEEVFEHMRANNQTFLYSNKKDSNILIRKRHGIAWTVNCGNFLTWLILGALVLSVFLAYFGLEFREKTFHEALGMDKDEFISFGWREEIDNEIVLIDEKTIEEIANSSFDLTLKRLTDNQFNKFFTQQKVIQLYGEKIMLFIGETYIGIIDIDKSSSKYYEIIETNSSD